MKDIQSSVDTRNVVLTKAGVKNVHLPFMIPTKAGSFQTVSAEISLSADLKAEAKGTHMSRFMEILNSASEQLFSIDAITCMLKQTVSVLDSASAYFTMKFRYFIKKQAPVSEKKGYIDYLCGFDAKYENGRVDTFFSMDIPITTLCPCSKEISDYGAHNQRAIVKVRVKYDRDEILWFEDVAGDIEKIASADLYSVLKRPDEKFITEKAYNNPKFVEDIVRDAVLYFKDTQGAEDFSVECESVESIHNHSAFTYKRFYAK